MQTADLRTANKGEWSELYVLFKLFSEKKIPAANSELEPVEDRYYRFLKIFREETAGQELEYNLEHQDKVLVLDKSGNLIKTLDSRDLKEKVRKIFNAIKVADTSSFPVNDLVDVMQEYLVNKVKANSTVKTDLLAILEDQTNITTEKMGFSIKSHVGGAPTLINSSSHTNFVFEVNDFSGNAEDVNTIQGRSKVRDRLQAIYDAGGKLSFAGVESETFTRNLQFTDTMFPQILASMLLDFYSGKGNDMATLAELVADRNFPGVSKDVVEYKVKGFLRAAALGMVPNTEWDTRLNAYGGYIVVLEDGGLVCYSLLKDDDFKDYLFRFTRFDTPSTERHKFGKIVTENGKTIFKLNLQIRFKK